MTERQTNRKTNKLSAHYSEIAAKPHTLSHRPHTNHPISSDLVNVSQRSTQPSTFSEMGNK